jgi:hypothetical protein
VREAKAIFRLIKRHSSFIIPEQLQMRSVKVTMKRSLALLVKSVIAILVPVKESLVINGLRLVPRSCLWLGSGEDSLLFPTKVRATVETFHVVTTVKELYGNLAGGAELSAELR